MPQYPYQKIGLPLDLENWERVNKFIADVELDFREQKTSNGNKFFEIDERLDDQDNRIDNIISQSGDSVVEIVDARQSTILDETFPTLRDRLEAEYNFRRYEVNVQEYGAKGDGIHDDTLAIRAAIQATPRGGTLRFPTTNAYYKVTQQAENYLFLINKPITIKGEGTKTLIGLDEAITDTTDVFLIIPETANGLKGYNLEKFVVVGLNSSIPARHAIHIDVTTSGVSLSDATFSKLHLYPTGGNSIYLTNPTNTDGFFTSQIEKNLIYSGIKLNRAGDSLTVTENVIPGFKGVDVTFVDGSNSFVFAFNNVTCRGGTRIGSGHNNKILYNNFESGYADMTGSNGAILDLDGVEITQDWGLLATEVKGNNFTFRTTSPDGIDAIRVNKARGAVIETNHIAQKNSNHIRITSLGQETVLGYNLYSSVDPYGIIVDNGVRTIRKDTVRIGLSSSREIYQAEAAILRYRAPEFVQHVDKSTYKPITLANAPTLNFEWNEANAFNSKYAIQTQKRFTNGTLEAAKRIATLADGYMYFADGGFALTDSAGFRWKVNISTTGALTTTRL